MSLTGDRIRELRIRLHLTLDDVAKHLGIGRQAVYKYEQGTVTNIPLENIEKMAALFDTTPAYLAGWDNNHFQFNLQQFSAQDPAEKQLVDTYRVLPDPGKHYLLQQAQAAVLLYGEKSDSVPSAKNG
ncbi:MAG: helix-turn-helix transcriptional regulator [Lachnospiraceae bacterium]|nr:helix-turn-helix transcriptional regulator [Lachnospiraceae bacterium]